MITNISIKKHVALSCLQGSTRLPLDKPPRCQWLSAHTPNLQAACALHAGTQQRSFSCLYLLNSSRSRSHRSLFSTTAGIADSIRDRSSIIISSSGRFQQQQPWRWFGFDSETTGLDVERDCVIQMAAYDLESGDSYVALVNPAFHKHDYVFGSDAFKHHGKPQHQQ